MDLHGFTWICMDLHGFRWIYMDFHILFSCWKWALLVWAPHYWWIKSRGRCCSHLPGIFQDRSFPNIPIISVFGEETLETQWLYGYGSIPIHTIFRGMNIHLPAILMFTRGIGFWPIPIFPYFVGKSLVAQRAEGGMPWPAIVLGGIGHKLSPVLSAAIGICDG